MNSITGAGADNAASSRRRVTTVTGVARQRGHHRTNSIKLNQRNPLTFTT